jgi:2-keto-4-pentenoate hydratase
MTVSHDTLAKRLREAYGGPATTPLRDGLEETDIAGAYAVQAINTDYWQTQNRRIVGRKIGLTAKVVQAQLGVNQPDFGVLFDDMEIENGGLLDPKLTLQPKAEAEVALILASDITQSDPTPEDIAAAMQCAIPALEIVDSRIADWKIAFADTVADNGSSAFFVLGEPRKPLDGLDLYSCGMVMEINDEIVSVGSGAACLGHPLIAAAWLAKTLNSVGQGLRAGDIVLTGALGPMVALAPGDRVVTKIGG